MKKLHKKINLAVCFITIFSFFLLIFMNTAVLLFPFAQGVVAIAITLFCFFVAGAIAKAYYRKLSQFVCKYSKQ